MKKYHLTIKSICVMLALSVSLGSAQTCLLAKETTQENTTLAGKILDMDYSTNRDDFSSDEIFANFRVMEGGKIKKDMFYRAASPVNNRYQRANYVDTLLEEHNINFILDLADNQKELEEYQKEDDFHSPYYLSLYDKGNVALINLHGNYRKKEYAKKLVKGLRKMLEKEGPYFIHCTEGKDRTGFVSILIESIAGFDYDELEKDYMTTYENYFGVTKDSDPAAYEDVMEHRFRRMLRYLIDDKTADEALLKKADLAAAVKNYLLDGGLTEEEFAKLKEIIQ